MSTDDRTRDPLGLGPGVHDLDAALRAIQRFEAQMRWEQGRRPAALKVGRQTYLDLREAISFRDAAEGGGVIPAFAPFGPLAGLPVYVCAAAAHWEFVYEDEDVLARLRDDPAAIRWSSQRKQTRVEQASGEITAPMTRDQEEQMAKRYRLHLTEVTAAEPSDAFEGEARGEEEIVRVSVSGDAHAVVGWLLSSAETVAMDARQEEGDILGHLYRLSTTQAERVARTRRGGS